MLPIEAGFARSCSASEMRMCKRTPSSLPTAGLAHSVCYCRCTARGRLARLWPDMRDWVVGVSVLSANNLKRCIGVDSRNGPSELSSLLVVVP